jgi:hypothetical protein
MNRSYAMFVGLNPSTADETEDDPTIRRCVDYAKRWRYGALCMTNLFAYRATDWAVLKAHPSPIGPENDRWLVEVAKGASVVVAAWGIDGGHLQRDQAIIQMLGRNLVCLSKTKNGHPGHPLYLKKSLTPIPFVA